MRETWTRTGNRIGVWMYRHLNGRLSSVAPLPSLRISVLRLSLKFAARQEEVVAFVQNATVRVLGPLGWSVRAMGHPDF